MTTTIFTCATTGLYRFDLAPGDPSQPRVIAIAATMFDAKWTERGSMHCLIRPEASVSAAGATAVHHITEREREIYGVRSKCAIAMFMDFTRSSTQIVAFNLPFMSGMIDVELARLGVSVDDWRRGGLTRTCAMEAAAQKVNGGHAMKLPEAHAKVTGIEYSSPERDKHVHDVKAVARIMMEVTRNERAA